ncbi:GyrI-like domain-containing protein [Pseudarthrobacter sp. NPDC058329]|uniref:GyrI-like domain-containing protein n=1 Tax=Pseudarthrobacter sp. NPDC058329 TaxID=3346448 RepID=UPI0036DD1DF5
MDKYDVRKQFKELYAPRTRDFEVVTVPALKYLMLDGQGNPGTSPAYTRALEALFSGIAKAAAKNVAGLDMLRLETLEEGLSAQILHIGSYDDEGPTLHRLHSEFLPANGFAFAGPHHEIYLSDARRVAPEKLKTILRQPVRRL